MLHKKIPTTAILHICEQLLSLPLDIQINKNENDNRIYRLIKKVYEK